MSDCARLDTVEAGSERSGSNRHVGSRRRAIMLKRTWWRWEVSIQARIERMELRGWKWEVSDCARIDMVEVECEHSGSIRDDGGRR